MSSLSSNCLDAICREDALDVSFKTCHATLNNSNVQLLTTLR